MGSQQEVHVSVPSCSHVFCLTHNRRSSSLKIYIITKFMLLRKKFIDLLNFESHLWLPTVMTSQPWQRSKVQRFKLDFVLSTRTMPKYVCLQTKLLKNYRLSMTNRPDGLSRRPSLWFLLDTLSDWRGRRDRLWYWMIKALSCICN